MITRKKVVALVLAGIVVGLLLVPKRSIDLLLWSKLERSAAAQGVSLSCEDPSFGLLGIDTGRCIVRRGLFGVELKFVRLKIAGLLPPRARFETEAFARPCTGELSIGTVNVSQCGVALATLPQLAALGFTDGFVTFSGVGERLENGTTTVNVSAQGERIEHPNMTSFRLGLRSNSPTAMIPAFSKGAFNSRYRASFPPSTGGEHQLQIQSIATSLATGSNGEFSLTPTGTLSGGLDFALSGDGERQFGALLEAFATPRGTDSSSPSPDRIGAKGYTLSVSGTARNPSLRVLK